MNYFKAKMCKCHTFGKKKTQKIKKKYSLVH